MSISATNHAPKMQDVSGSSVVKTPTPSQNVQSLAAQAFSGILVEPEKRNKEANETITYATILSAAVKKETSLKNAAAAPNAVKNPFKYAFPAFDEHDFVDFCNDDAADALNQTELTESRKKEQEYIKASSASLPFFTCLQRAEAKFADGQYEKALIYVNKAWTTIGAHKNLWASTRLLKAKIHVKLGGNDHFNTALNMLAQLKEPSEEAIQLKLEILYKTHDFKSYSSAMKDYYESHPKSSFAALHYAINCFENALYLEANRAFSKINKAENKEVAMYLKVIEFLASSPKEKNTKASEAIEFLDKSETAQASAKALLKAFVYYKMDHLHAAHHQIAEYAERERNPRQFGIFLTVKIKARLNDYTGAIASFSEMHKPQGSGFFQGLFELIGQLYHENHFDHAFNMFKQMEPMYQPGDPSKNSSILLHCMGNCLAAARKFKRAMTFYNEILTVDPNYRKIQAIKSQIATLTPAIAK